MLLRPCYSRYSTWTAVNVTLLSSWAVVSAMTCYSPGLSAPRYRYSNCQL